MILPVGIDQLFTYIVPEGVEVVAGMRVRVPFRWGEKVGIVWEIKSSSQVPESKLKALSEVLDSLPLVDENQCWLWQWVKDYYVCSFSDIFQCAILNKLLKVGVDKPISCRTKALNVPIRSAIPLDKQQHHCYDEIVHSFTTDPLKPVLLHGVTSSGKTEVYIHLLTDTLARHQNALYLVPEIALTTQLTSRLQAVFGDKVLVYHSRFTENVRAQIYQRLRQGVTGYIVLGVRSSVWLPFSNLGLVIVDEEHDRSYKQTDSAPRYHARTMALILAQHHGAQILLGSATPSVESYHLTRQDRYTLCTMPDRHGGFVLPPLHIVDMCECRRRKEMNGVFSDEVVHVMTDTLSRGEQIILFQPRRGYSPRVVCEQCGFSYPCEHCSVEMTYHKSEGMMRCHYCGFSIPKATICPKCGGVLREQGVGTEHLEEDLHVLFPQVRVERLDLDTTRLQGSHEAIIGRMSQREIDILVGTQMVTKGLDFSGVSLVVVPNADGLDAQPSFRSDENAFQLLEQVSGRAGRNGSGAIYIQTYRPTNPLFAFVKAHDFIGLFEMILEQRQLFHYPPFYRLIAVTFKHPNVDQLLTDSKSFMSAIRSTFGRHATDLIVPSIAFQNRLYARVVMLKFALNDDIRYAKQLLVALLSEATHNDTKLVIQIDVDPL